MYGVINTFTRGIRGMPWGPEIGRPLDWVPYGMPPQSIRSGYNKVIIRVHTGIAFLDTLYVSDCLNFACFTLLKV
jgi:hypothetical protein